MADAGALARAAMDRMDANRTARRELLAVLGDPPRPWVGTGLGVGGDRGRARRGPGARSMPAPSWSASTSRPAASWRSGPRGPGRPSSAGGPSPRRAAASTRTTRPGQPIPTGAQRALAVLRRFVDEAGARRRGYVRIMTDAPALAAPDQAVVAAFERIDVVIADPMREVVAGRVDPDRAIADHVFAHRLLARAGHAGAGAGRAADRRPRPRRRHALGPGDARRPRARDAAAGGRARPPRRAGRRSRRRGRLPGLAGRGVRRPGAGRRRDRPPARAAARTTRSRSSSRRWARTAASMWHAIVGALLADAGDDDGDRAPARRVGRGHGPDARHHAASPRACGPRASCPSCAAPRSTMRRGRSPPRHRRCARSRTRGWSALVDEPHGHRLGAPRGGGRRGAHGGLRPDPRGRRRRLAATAGSGRRARPR